jgi:hypothetical protein
MVAPMATLIAAVGDLRGCLRVGQEGSDRGDQRGEDWPRLLPFPEDSGGKALALIVVRLSG